MTSVAMTSVAMRLVAALKTNEVQRVALVPDGDGGLALHWR